MSTQDRDQGLDGLPREVLRALVHAEPRSAVPPPTFEAERANLILLKRALGAGARGGPTEGAPGPVGDGWTDEG